MHRWSVSSLAALTPKLFWMSIWECIKSETHYIIRSYTRSLRSRWLSKPQIKSLVDWAKIKWFAPFFTSAQTGVHFIKMYTSPWKGCDKRRLRGRGSGACKRNNSKEDIGQASAGMIHLTQFAKRLKIERTGRSDQVGDIWASLSSHAWFHWVVTLLPSLLMVREKIGDCECYKSEGLQL